MPEEFEDQVTVTSVIRDDKTAEQSIHVGDINKYVKYLRSGNISSTIIAVSSLKEFDMTVRGNQKSLKDVGGIDPLLGLLSSQDPKLQEGSARILKDASRHPIVALDIADQRGIEVLVDVLDSSSGATRAAVAETIGHCCVFGVIARKVRLCGGIRRLLHILKKMESAEEADTAVAVSFALFQIAQRSAHNRDAIIRAANGVSIVLKTLVVFEKGEEITQHCAGVLLQLLRLPAAMAYFLKYEGPRRVLDRLRTCHSDLCKSYIAGVVAGFATTDELRTLVRTAGGLNPIAGLLSSSDASILKNSSSAVRELCKLKENVGPLNECGAVSSLISLLNHAVDIVQSNAAIAVANCAKNDAARGSIRSAGGVVTIVRLLHSFNPVLLANVCEAIAELAEDDSNLKVIFEEDGVRMLWSLLRHDSSAVQAKAAFAVGRCLKDVERAAHIGRTFVNGLPLLVELLRREDDAEVQAGACCAVARMAKHPDNLNVLVEEGGLRALATIVQRLGKGGRGRRQQHMPLDDSGHAALLMENAAEALESVAATAENRRMLGELDAVVPLSSFLRNRQVPSSCHAATALAMKELSEDAKNARMLRDANSVVLLMDIMQLDDERLQLAAARTVENIRKAFIAAGK